MAGFKLTPEATNDLEDIWRYTAEHWGIDQAIKYVENLNKAFILLAETPEMSRAREEFSPNVRIHTHEKHMIVYLIESTHITVVRVLHKNMLPENHL
ncbi:MAG: type II toxin-antitoxin system RelE/ParE family toxin [Gammaproteobacteria bacterium]|nr:type II toxin-antitoxin system RelE/ParE family toxin [Gammaproteobacteria bacterium]